MTKFLANTISIILHPLAMPTLGLIYILTANSEVFLLPWEAKRIIITVVAINTFALPLLMVSLFYRLSIIKSLQMQQHRERIIPLTFTLIPYLFSFYFLSRIPILSEIPFFLLGASITVGLALLISIWWKVSIHMIGIGGIVGMLFALSYRFYLEVLWPMIIVLMLAGFLAWARLKLKSHNPAQVYAGFFLGWVTISVCIIVL